MSESQCELVFYGELVPGAAPDQVRRNVAELFKASIEQVERMFSGQRVVIRNKLDQETAQKYVIAMQKRGAVCKIESMGGSAQAPAPKRVEPSAPPRAAEAAPAPATPKPAPAPTRAKPEAEAPGRLKVAGEKVDSILAGKDISVAPVGERLSEHHEVAAPVFEHLDDIELAPVGANLQDEREELPVSVPDTSHLKLE